MKRCFRKSCFLLVLFFWCSFIFVYPQVSPSLDEVVDSGIRYLSGCFSVEGETVEVFFQLVSELNNVSLGSQRLAIQKADLNAISIDMLPANISTAEEAKRNEEIFNSQVQTLNSTLKISAWPNSDTYTFFEGEDLKINIISDHDCYFKVYHVDTYNMMQMIYPNAINRDDRLFANIVRVIPEGGIKYNIQAPFGQDSIIMVASNHPFTTIETEFGKIEQLTKCNVRNVMIGRGIGVQPSSSVQSSEVASKQFNYTSLAINPAID